MNPLTAVPCRQDSAVWLLTRRHLIRGRVKRRLRGLRIAGLDLDDVTSSVLRRVDAAFVRGLLHPRSQSELWAYVLILIDNLVLTKLRDSGQEHHHRAPSVTSEPTQFLTARFRRCGDESEAVLLLHRMLMSMRNDNERELVIWRLRGTSYRVIAATTGESEVQLRKRWTRLCRELNARFSGDRVPDVGQGGQVPSGDPPETPGNGSSLRR